MRRRTILGAVAAVVAVGTSAAVAANTTQPRPVGAMTVYKSPSCGCCAKWVEYLERDGFTVNVVDKPDVTPIKQALGVTPRLASCHTAVIDGYVIEGHVPAADIRRLLAERPPVIGLTAPGMPQFSPGMRSETPRGYDVLSFDQHGGVQLFARY